MFLGCAGSGSDAQGGKGNAHLLCNPGMQGVLFWLLFATDVVWFTSSEPNSHGWGNGGMQGHLTAMRGTSMAR
jgi:hypothetical protein